VFNQVRVSLSLLQPPPLPSFPRTEVVTTTVTKLHALPLHIIIILILAPLLSTHTVLQYPKWNHGLVYHLLHDLQLAHRELPITTTFGFRRKWTTCDSVVAIPATAATTSATTLVTAHAYR
jgi:hypothetical protein